MNAFYKVLVQMAEESGATSVLPLIELAEQEQVTFDDLHHWVVGLKGMAEHKHLFRQDLPTGPNWTHVAIPAASSVQDYDEPTIITIDGKMRQPMGMSGGLYKTHIQTAYFFQTDTEARDWWAEHGHKLEKYLRGIETKIFPLYTPVDPD